MAGQRTDLLKKALEGANQLIVSDRQGNAHPPFILEGREKIAELIDHLEFDDLHSGFHCMCLGDSLIVFFKGEEKLATLSHHHGQSLRWDGWEGDSLFTKNTAEFWRIWFLKQGEPRFQDMYLAKVERELEERRIDALFLSAFPEGAAKIFKRAANSSRSGTNTEQFSDARELAALFHSRTDFANALARGLGSLSICGADTGSWSVSSSREQLVLECTETLSSTEFLAVLESSDEEVLAGAARLFFFEGLSAILPPEERNPLAAKLCETVLRVDRCGNADMAIRALRRFPCPETTFLLERLADGQIQVALRSPGRKDEPSPRTAACLILAYTSSPKLLDCIRETESIPSLDDFDQAALRVARALGGESGLLDPSIFELRSYTIAYGALDALEKEGGRDAIDAVIRGGTNHSWAAVKVKALAVAGRMTGHQWEGKGWWNQARKARAWWESVRGSWAE